MEFELTREIVSEIIFGMENQVRDMVLDTETRKVLSREVAGKDYREDEFRFLPLPVWRPVEGFQLMERFTGTLHNPLVQAELRKALDSGKGVFRNFKAVIKDKPEISRLWYTFKDHEMKQRVLDWYNDLAETWGFTRKAGKLSDYLEPTDDLVREDFAIEEISGQRDLIIEIESAFKPGFEPLHGIKAFRMVTPGGKTAGLIWGICNKPERMMVKRLFVFKEFRGIGLAKALLKRFCDEASRFGAVSAGIILPKKALYLESMLEDLGFTIIKKVMKLDLR